MGIIIGIVPPENRKDPKGIRLYYQHYKVVTGIERKRIMQLIARDLGCTSIYEQSFLKNMTPQDALELIGYAAAKRNLKTTKAAVDYYNKLSEIIEKYGLGVTKNAKVN